MKIMELLFVALNELLGDVFHRSALYWTLSFAYVIPNLVGQLYNPNQL